MNFLKPLLLKSFAALPQPLVDRLISMRWRYSAVDRLLVLAADSFRNTDMVIQEGLGQGLLFNAGKSHASYLLGTTELSTQRVLGLLLRQDMTFYDIGANVGFLSVIAARLVGPGGGVIAFEPLPANVRQLRYNGGLNGFENIQILEMALGADDGESTFWISSRPTWGKLVSTGKVPDKLIGETEVMVRRLDTLITERGLPAPSVMKIDVEGAEVDVLSGAIETLRRHRPRLLIELHGTNGAVDDLLSSLEYKTAVLGEAVPITQAYWNAEVIAIPCEEKWPVGLPAPPVTETPVGTSG